MPSSPASDHPLGPSDTLCELALALVTEIDAYEKSGGTAIIDDVVLTEPYRPYFDPAESTTGRARPGWRWEVALRDATHRETVIGEANGGWSVAGVASLRGRVDHPRPGSVVIDEHGSQHGLKPPPPDRDSPANRALVGGVSGGVMAISGVAGLAAFAFGRRKVGIRSPGWHVDPSQRFTLRYWNGVDWTRFVYHVPEPP